MSLAPEKSLVGDGSPGDFQFGWDGNIPPESGMEPGAKHNSSLTLSPALIAMFVVLGSAFLIVSYYKIFSKFCKYRRWRLWRRRRSFESEEVVDLSQGGLFQQDSNGWQIYAPSSYGLDEAIIKSIPLCMFRKEEKFVDEVECSVCLVEFKDNEALRILPKCSHAFHVNCIDVWLRSHANCPLCRANVVVFNGSENPWVPAMADRIRPNLEHGMAGVVHDRFRSDDVQIMNITNTDNGEYVAELQQETEFQNTAVVIDLEPEESRGNWEDLGGETFEENLSGYLNSQPVLSRSYSFGCSSNENFSTEPTTHPDVSLDSFLLTETAASSPWKRAFKRFNSPFGSKGGIFSLRSPFFNRSRGGSTSNFSSMLMFPLSPARDHHRRRNYSHGGGGLTRIRGGSLSPPFMRVNQANRAQSMTSPLFMKRSSFSLFTPNRLRSGDPEALLSPDRFNHHPNE